MANIPSSLPGPSNGPEEVARITFLFTDIESSTQLLETLGEEFGAVVKRHFDILREAALTAGGREIDARPDSYFAVFARASNAVNAAAKAQQMLFREMWPRGVQLRVRMGIHTGRANEEAVGLVGLDVQ